MPIRLNLLAETQAIEEMRRRDPVKRAIYVAAVLIFGMLAWSTSLQLKAIIAKGELGHVEAQLASHNKDYKQVLENQKAAVDTKQRLAALRQLTTNRFLYGNLLNALQHTTVEDLQLMRVRAEQSYVRAEEVKPKTDDSGHTTPGKPATATERMLLAMEGTDSSLNPGDQINRFREVLATNAYFKTALAKTNPVTLKNLSAPQISPSSGKSCVLFTLECRYPEMIR